MAYILIAAGLVLLSVGIYLVLKPIAKIDNKEKGNLFEDYIIQKVAKMPNAEFISKNSDYFHKGISASENTEPDLKFKIEQQAIAIECKWRAKFDSRGEVIWAKEYQIANYKRYQSEKKQPVFIAIGIGGSPAMPAELYIIPLYRVSKLFVTREFLAEFKVKPKRPLTFSLESNRFE